MRGITTHARLGGIANAFRYGVDYVLIDPDNSAPTPTLFSRNRFNLNAVHDRDHGGARGKGEGVHWARRVFAQHGLDTSDLDILLLTQPRFLGYWFNPVSFWLAMRGERLVAVISEVNNPFGDRHSYLCHNPGFDPIAASDTLVAHKAFHVSPFQRLAGDYRFNFDIRPDRIAIRIALKDGKDGLIATLSGRRDRLTNRAILGASLRRPAGALRTIALIYWQALKLKLKGARYRTRPEPPTEEVS
jgi:DUF1365 family protein